MNPSTSRREESCTSTSYLLFSPKLTGRLVVLLVFLGGCAVPQTGNLQTRISIPRWIGWKQNQTIDQNEITEDSPFYSEELADHTNADNVRQAHSSANNAVSSQQVNSEVLQLVELEFRNESPQEKQRWLEILKNVDPKFVPELIWARRMSLQKAEMADKSASRDTSVLSPESARPAIHDSKLLLANNEVSNREQVIELNPQPSVSAPDPHSNTFQPDGPTETGPDGPPVLMTVTPASIGSDNIPTLPGAGIEIRSGSAANNRKTGQTSWDLELQRLIAVAESEIAELTLGTNEEQTQHYVSRHVYLRMLYLMSGQQGRALQPIEGIEPAEQEFWQQMLWGVANYFDTKQVKDKADRANLVVSQLDEASRKLRETAKLELRNVNFCRNILSYGNFEAFERDEFSPDQLVLLYTEVRNFVSHPNEQNEYVTELSSRVEIYEAGPNGKMVWENNFEPVKDFCRVPRRDYYQGYKFNLPPTLSSGPHVLKLIVADEQSRKVASYNLKFNVR